MSKRTEKPGAAAVALLDISYAMVDYHHLAVHGPSSKTAWQAASNVRMTGYEDDDSDEEISFGP